MANSPANSPTQPNYVLRLAMQEGRIVVVYESEMERQIEIRRGNSSVFR